MIYFEVEFFSIFELDFIFKRENQFIQFSASMVRTNLLESQSGHFRTEDTVFPSNLVREIVFMNAFHITK